MTVIPITINSNMLVKAAFEKKNNQGKCESLKCEYSTIKQLRFRHGKIKGVN